MLCDNANKGMILGLKENGFNVIALGKDKVVNGIYQLQDYQIIVTKDSTNIQNELYNYVWLDKDGEYPIDNHNHSLDPLRYCEKYHRLKYL
jgi:phage terminase large subunit